MEKKRYLNLVVVAAIILTLVLYMIFAPNPRYVLLSFDVELVDNYNTLTTFVPMLEKNNIKATFFITGQFAERNKDIVDYFARHGHEIACHSYDHSIMTSLSINDKKKQLQQCYDIIINILRQSNQSITSIGFRAPEHAIDAETFKLLKELNYKYDASLIKGLELFYPKPTLPEIMLSSVLLFPVEDYMFMRNLGIPGMFFTVAKMKKGSYISLLMHPRYIAKYPVELGNLLDHYKKNGAKFITYSEFLESKITKTRQFGAIRS